MNTKEEIRNLYDGYWRTVSGDIENGTVALKELHENVSPTLKYFRNRKIDTAVRLGRFGRNDHLMEVGANKGQYTVLLAERGFHVTGTDLSGIVEIARMHAGSLGLENVSYIEADVEDLSQFPDATFDGVVSFSTLRYVPNLERAIGEIFRVTRAGGAAVLDFPNRFCPWFKYMKKHFGVPDHIHDRRFSAREIESLFRAAGFTEVESTKILFTHYTFPPSLMPVYRIIDAVAENTPLIKEMAAIILCKGVKPGRTPS